ncbi:MarR family winged helix-turn-helix transcriptional regulator [Secundilactobacillus paracollinoides]|uniref:MarR family winged helix-turn-helix transcriptional regulator n=1 Tax=Secundilactobacillus paracollinoides TaxID=240427 RepID=UPI0006D28FEA|nr:MarR family transcriptional regulator [Secundilactobacillus paracollinoides]
MTDEEKNGKQIWRDIGWIAREVNGTANREWRDERLDDNRFIYVIRVLEQPGIGMQALATAIGVDRTTAFRAVSKLVTDGYLEKRDHPTQPRLKVLFPTQKSLALKTRLFRFESETFDRYLHGLSSAEVATLERLLERVRLGEIENNKNRLTVN